MDKVFFISITIAGILSAAVSFIPEDKFSKGAKIIIFILIIVCLGFQGWYGMKEKKASDEKAYQDAVYQDESLRRQASISKDIGDLREKEKKGLLTNNDYSLYISRYLESIDNTLKYRDGKNTREWVTTYYEEVAKIPSFFNFEEWLRSENLIYESMVNEINGFFVARGTFDSGMRPKLLETFKQERETLLNAKKRNFPK